MFLEEVAGATRELVDAGLLSKRYYEEMGANADRLQVEAIFRSIRRTINNVSPSFVVSFCRHEDGSEQFQHGLLSQWRGYAGRGGFAFEFDEEGLDALLKAEVERFFFGPGATRDVLYNNFEQIFHREDYEGLAKAIVGQIFLDPKVTPVVGLTKRKKIAEIAGEKNVDQAIAKYVSVAPFLKHYGFHEEREYRIAISCLPKHRIPAGAKKPAKPIEFRTRGDLILPYVRLFGEPGAKLPIKGVIVGPHPHQTLQGDAIERLLQETDCGAYIRLSGIPFRG